MILGTISAVDNDNGLQLIIDGEDSATTKKYTYMASYVPTANDRVLIEEVGGSYVIMGKVINDVASSGIARSATNASNADHATSADSATSIAGGGTTNGLIVSAVDLAYNSQIGNYVRGISFATTAKDYMYK